MLQFKFDDSFLKDINEILSTKEETLESESVQTKEQPNWNIVSPERERWCVSTKGLKSAVVCAQRVKYKKRKDKNHVAKYYGTGSNQWDLVGVVCGIACLRIKG